MTKALILALILTATLGAGLPIIPYASLQDVKDDQIVGSQLDSTCAEDDLLALALHDPATGYWMLWMTAKAWIMASYGPTLPANGTRAKTAILGLWKDTAARTEFVVSRTVTLPATGTETRAILCQWLFPPEA